MNTQAASDLLESAIARHEAGNLAEAERLYQDVLAIEPDEPDALNLLGLILQERGQLARSIELISKALHLDPDFPEALTNLARAQLAAGHPALAVTQARRAVELDPELAEAHLILCRALIDLKEDYGAAVAAGTKAASLVPNSVEALDYLGRAQEGRRNWFAAAAAYRQALALRPDNLPLKVRYGVVLAELGQHETAQAMLREAIAQAPNEVPPWIGLGMALAQAGQFEESISAFDRALGLAPDRAHVVGLQANNYEALGQFEQATIYHKRCLELDPENVESRRALAKLGRLDNAGDETARLQAVLNDESKGLWPRVLAGFALGTLHDKAGEFDKAFPAFEAGNRLARAYHARNGEVFAAEHFRQVIDANIREFDPASLAVGRLKGNPSELPVFIVGMPRSGTTLVEQIACSHPRIHGLGETMDIYDITKRLEARNPGQHPSFWDTDSVQQEAAAHLARLQAIALNADRVIDKLPDNVMMLGRIATLFPRSRVILCRRDMRDVCLSCFFQLFSSPVAWSLDLRDCGVYARQTARLMDHWVRAQPVRILEMRYEDLVGDLEGQSRRLIDFLGMKWDPACLEFHKTERAVITASQWQVRQPLYASSVGRWRQYRKHLGPLLEGLGDLVDPNQT